MQKKYELTSSLAFIDTDYTLRRHSVEEGWRTHDVEQEAATKTRYTSAVMAVFTDAAPKSLQRLSPRRTRAARL
jgi:hypothetical protein